MSSPEKNLLRPQAKNNNDDFINRRKEQRLPAHIPSILLKQGHTIYTTIINLSSSGVGFLSAIPLNTNDEVEITFERKTAHTMVPVELKVHVRSCREVDFEYYIGGSIEKKSLEFTKFFEKIEDNGKTTEEP